MINPKFIGTVGWNDVTKTIRNNPWEPIAFYWPPYSVIKPSPHYLLTMGSGCFASLATTSVYNHTYYSAIDVFRQDYVNGTVAIDIDHFIAREGRDSFYVYRYPPTNYHHLKPSDEIITHVPQIWQPYLKKIAKGDIVL